MKTISSRQHPVVRAFRQLAGEPDPAGERLLLDGVHQVREARGAGIAFEAIAVAGERLHAATEEGDLARSLEHDGTEAYSVSDQVLAAISPVRSPSGIVAIGRRTPVNASAICRHDDAFVLIAVDVQDPGNLGALIRAAEAGGATGVIVCGTSANPFSWKALRGSMGSTLRLPVAHGVEAPDVVACAKRFGARTVAAVARGGLMPDAITWSGRVALFLGGEGSGLDPEVVSHCDERVTIPMAPPVESLNVAVAGAVLVYAARRQRT
jgi:TrmH family RNA methyltransferase